MTNDELKTRLENLLSVYPKNPIFNSMWQELNTNSSNTVIQKTLQLSTAPFIERCDGHLKNAGIFQKIFYAPELREIKALKKQLLYDNNDYQEKLNHKFFSDLKSKLMYSLESYIENFHLKKIASDRKAQALNLLSEINNIDIENKASTKIADLFNILFQAQLSIIQADASAKKPRNLTNSRLKTIVQNYSQLISKKNRPTIRTAIASTELEKTYLEFTNPLRNKISYLKENSTYNNKCLYGLDSRLTEQDNNYQIQSDKKVIYSTIFTRLNTALDWIVAEDKKLWFANFRHTNIKQVLTSSILEILNFSRRNHLLTPYIVEALNHQIKYLWQLHVEKHPPERISRTGSNQSMLFEKSLETNVLKIYDLPRLHQAVPSLLKPIIFEYINFLNEAQDLQATKHQPSFSLLM